MKKLILSLCVFASFSHAATVISFTDQLSNDSGSKVVTGYGELSFADGLTTLGLPDLYSFAYDSTVTDLGVVTVNPTVQLADITGFSLQLGSNDLPSDLTLTTLMDNAQASSSFQMGQVYGQGPLTIGGFQDGVAGNVNFTVLTDQTSVPYVPIVGADMTAAPEPRFALCLVGCALLGLGWRHRKILAAKEPKA